MIAERIQIAPVQGAGGIVDEPLRLMVEPMMSALASAAPAVQRGLIGLLLRAAATAADQRPAT